MQITSRHWRVSSNKQWTKSRIKLTRSKRISTVQSMISSSEIPGTGWRKKEPYSRTSSRSKNKMMQWWKMSSKTNSREDMIKCSSLLIPKKGRLKGWDWTMRKPERGLKLINRWRKRGKISWDCQLMRGMLTFRGVPRNLERVINLLKGRVKRTSRCSKRT